MIIKGLRIRSKSGVHQIIRHLQNGDDNERVEFLRGTTADIKDMQKDAISKDTTYAVRHWIIAPSEVTTRPQMQQVLEMLALEFGFNLGRAVIVEHCKKRTTAVDTDIHWHILVGEVDPTTGGILRTSFDRVLHELIARICEYNFGHKYVLGKHTKAVINGLRKRALNTIAASLKEAIEATTSIPFEAFSHAQHQEKKRLEIDVPLLRQVIKNAATNTKSKTIFLEKLARHGMIVAHGDKQNTWIVKTIDGKLIGALHRLASKRKSEINQLLTETPIIRTGAIPTPSLAPDEASLQPAIETKEHKKVVNSKPTLLEQLRILEKSSIIDAEIEIPQYRQSQELKTKRKDLRERNTILNSQSDTRWDRYEELQNIKIRWWFYLLGIAAEHKNKATSLQHQIEGDDSEMKIKSTLISVRESQIYRSEKIELEEHKTLVHRISVQKKAAVKNLETITAARELLKLNSANFTIEVDQILKMAEEHIQQKNDQHITAHKF